MERLKLENLVAFAKNLVEEPLLYRPGMQIVYELEQNEMELLQLEIYAHTNKTEVGFKPSKKFEFEFMDVRFLIRRA